MRSALIFAALCFTCSLGAGCSGSGGGDDACKGIDCSGHGSCGVVDGQALCECLEGYTVSADGTKCLPGTTDPCRPYDCSSHGRCHTDDQDQPYCECNTGYWPSADKLDCIENNCSVNCGLMGCCGTRCCRLVPSNAADLGELPDSGPSKSASGSFDTESDCKAASQLGDCQLVSLTLSPDVCVCRLGDLNVAGSLSIRGAPALAVFASGSVTIGGDIELSAARERPGPGYVAQPEEASNRLGGRGGSFGTGGGGGGAARGNRELVPLAGGESGQDGCGARFGGGGGGLLQISAVESIIISGSIISNGGGGKGGDSATVEFCCGGAGGGSGGGVLLEAPQVTFTGSFRAHGGGGGGGGNNRGATGGDGADASAGGTPAPGGAGRDGASCALYGAIEGGDGGLGSVGDSPGGNGQATDRNMCDPDQPYVGGGGSGGGSGRLRINTSASAPCDCGGAFSPSPTFGVIVGG